MLVRDSARLRCLGSLAAFLTSLALIGAGYPNAGAPLCVISLSTFASSAPPVAALLAALVAGPALGAPGFGAMTAWTASTVSLAVLCQRLAWERGRWRRRARRRAEILRRESRLAVSTQQHLLPRSLPRPSGYEITACTVPARELGGDLYDAFEDRSGIFLAVGDVSGKGVAAALLMPLTMATLRLHARSTDQLTEVAARLSQTLFETTDDARYVSMFLARLDPVTHRLRYVNAGHFPPCLFRAGAPPCLFRAGAPVWLERGGPPLGMLEGATFDEGEESLLPGDTLVMYTDGLIDAEHIESWRTELPERLLGAQRGWLDQAGAPCAGARTSEVMHDDLTVMILRRHWDQ